MDNSKGSKRNDNFEDEFFCNLHGENNCETVYCNSSFRQSNGIRHLVNTHNVFHSPEMGKKVRKNTKERSKKRKRDYDTETEDEDEECEQKTKKQKTMFKDSDLFVSFKRLKKQKRKKRKYKKQYFEEKTLKEEEIKERERIEKEKNQLKKELESSKKQIKKEEKAKELLKEEKRKLERLNIDYKLNCKLLEESKIEIERLQKLLDESNKNNFVEMKRLCELLKKKDKTIKELREERKIEDELEAKQEISNLLVEKKELIDTLAVWKQKFKYQSTVNSDQFKDLEKNMKELSFLQKIIDNLNTMIDLFPHNCPIRKELLAQLIKNEVDQKEFTRKILIPSGLKPSYWKKLKKLTGTSHLFMKNAMNVKRKRWSDETLSSFVDILDEIIPFRSGRNYRTREKGFVEIFIEYNKIMLDRYPNVPMFGYTTFWKKFRDRHEGLRFVAKPTWCPLCEIVNTFGPKVEEAKRSGDWSNVDFEWNEPWYQHYLVLKEFHLKEVHNQFSYYQELKKSILDNKDEEMFLIVQDFSKLEIEKGDTYQDQIFTVYYYDRNVQDIVSYKYIHYVDNSKNDKYFFFKSWEALLEDCPVLESIRNNPNGRFKISIFSDGARKHYKQKFSITWMGFLQKKYENINFEWNFFLSNHGFNSCDSAGSHAKRKLDWFLQMFRHERLGTAVNVARCITYDETEEVKWRGVKNHLAYSLTGLIPTRLINNPDMDVEISELSKKHRFVFYTENERVKMKVYKLSEKNFNSDITLDFTLKQTLVFSNRDLETMERFWDEMQTKKQDFEREQTLVQSRINDGSNVQQIEFDPDEELPEPNEDDGGEFVPSDESDEEY